MKKELKILLTIIISILFFGLNVDASTGDGICYGRTIDKSGYCTLDQGVMIRAIPFEYRPLMLSNGEESVKFGYKGVVEGIDQDMFCIDSNLNSPGNQPYKLARPLNLNNDYDRAIAKVYSMYVNDTAYLMNQSNISFDAASKNYIQIANVVMRAITIKYKYDIVGADEIRSNIFDNVYAQFEGKNARSPKLQETSKEYKLAQKYYCSAITTCKDCNKVADATNFCSGLEKVSTSENRKFDIKIVSNPDVEQNISSDTEKFTKVIELKVTGLNAFTSDYATYAKTNPYFKVTNVKCENAKLDCGIESGLNLNTDILPGLTGNEYTFKVKVTGNRNEFKTESTGNIIVEYEFHHVMNSNNLAVLRYTTGTQQRQRMIALMPKRSEAKDVKVSFPLPALCQTEIVDRKVIYKYGGQEVSELEYLQSGCCNVRSARLKDRDAKNHYFQYCDTEQDIHLDTHCANEGTPDDMSHSYVRQKPVIDIVRAVEDLERNPQNYDSSSLENVLDNYKYHLDESYLYNSSHGNNNIVSTSNKYCKMYTSERQEIYYPGTAEATSGRFFIFNGQPQVMGDITGIFHTDIAGWERDYLSAIDREQSAFSESPEAYEEAQYYRETLEKYKEECESKTDIVNDWKYYLAPDLYFNYQQEYLDPSTNRKKKVTEQVKLIPSYRAEKYWPEVSDRDPVLDQSSVEGRERRTTKYFTSGGKSYSFSYDQTANYKARFRQTLYYIPETQYYSLMPDGKYVTSVEQYEATNYLDIGYVFNVNLTTYQGEYTTWFTINNIGHLMERPSRNRKNTSNIQHLLNEYLDDNKDILDITDTDNKIDGSEFVNKCYYSDEEILYRRDCPTCEETTDGNFKVQYFTRSISNNNVFPNANSGDRQIGSNWNNPKGEKARKTVEQLNDSIYGDIDGSLGHLEGSFILTPSIMQEYKKKNKETTYNDFYLTCMSQGKECLSSLLEELAVSSNTSHILENARKNLWKYYIEDEWVSGTLTSGRVKQLLPQGYPEETSGLPYWP